MSRRVLARSAARLTCPAQPVTAPVPHGDAPPPGGSGGDLESLSAVLERTRAAYAEHINSLDPQAPPWYRIEDAAEGPATVYLMGSIGGYGGDAGDFVRNLDEVKAKEIHLRVNSPGGDVFGGLAIMNAIARHPATVTAFIDGLAASAASFVVQAADRIVMGRQARMMIHDAIGMCIGNAADMAETMKLLDMISNDIAACYAQASGAGNTATWRARMRETSWYNAEEAVAAGLADDCAPPAEPRKKGTEADGSGDCAPKRPRDSADTAVSGRSGELFDGIDLENLAEEMCTSLTNLADPVEVDMAGEFTIAMGGVARDMPVASPSGDLETLFVDPDEMTAAIRLVAEDMPALAEPAVAGDSTVNFDDHLVFDSSDFYNSIREALAP